MKLPTFVVGKCSGPHDFVLDEKGHECRRCHLREEINHGQKFALDPFIPEGEIRFVQDGLVVGRITGLCN